jgi:hypothetical protein
LYGGKYVIRCQRPPEALERELTNGFDGHSILNSHQHPRTNQDLPWLGFVAKPRGDIGNRPDGGVVEPPLKADGAKRGKSLRDADAEAPQ